mgnify:CR=1 FL=1
MQYFLHNVLLSESPINENIRKKIRELTDDKNEILFCERLLEKEILYQNDNWDESKATMKKWLEDLFPYKESDLDE